MKPNTRTSQVQKGKPKVLSRLGKVLKAAGTRSVREVPFCCDTVVTVLTLEKHYGPVLELCRKMFCRTKEGRGAVVIDPSDKSWREAGLDKLNPRERILIRRLCEAGGYPTAFTGSGLIISPRKREAN